MNGLESRPALSGRFTGKARRIAIGLLIGLFFILAGAINVLRFGWRTAPLHHHLAILSNGPAQLGFGVGLTGVIALALALKGRFGMRELR